MKLPRHTVHPEPFDSAVHPELAEGERPAQGRRVEGRADLHLHTHHSDGTFSPEEVIRRAKGLKLGAVSITDHDTVAGIPAAKRAAGNDLEVIPGVEMTARFKDREIHILGYGIRTDDPDFSGLLERMQTYRVDRIQKMVDRLKTRGVQVRMEEVQAVAGKGSLGRPHLAQVLVKRGAVGSVNEAFERYLGDDAPCFVKGATLTVPEAVRLIRQAGGVAVLAHPHRLVEDSQIPELVAAGIQGIEVCHCDHPASVEKRYRRITERLGLLATGGSDCHGLLKSNGPLIGSVTIPKEWVERLKRQLG